MRLDTIQVQKRGGNESLFGNGGRPRPRYNKGAKIISISLDCGCYMTSSKRSHFERPFNIVSLRPTKTSSCSG